MKIHKYTHGYVAQTFDTETKQWIDQEFIASFPVEYADANTGEAIESYELGEPEAYLPFEMKQPSDIEQHVTDKFDQQFTG